MSLEDKESVLQANGLRVVKRHAKFTGLKKAGKNPDLEIFDESNRLVFIGEVKSPDHDLEADFREQLWGFAKKALEKKAKLVLAFSKSDLKQAQAEMKKYPEFAALEELGKLKALYYEPICIVNEKKCVLLPAKMKAAKSAFL